jgi:hypothetical protein
MHDMTFPDHPRNVKPGVVRSVPRRPHHHPNIL